MCLALSIENLIIRRKKLEGYYVIAFVYLIFSCSVYFLCLKEGDGGFNVLLTSLPEDNNLCWKSHWFS